MNISKGIQSSILICHGVYIPLISITIIDIRTLSVSDNFKSLLVDIKLLNDIKTRTLHVLFDRNKLNYQIDNNIQMNLLMYRYIGNNNENI